MLYIIWAFNHWCFWGQNHPGFPKMFLSQVIPAPLYKLSSPKPAAQSLDLLEILWWWKWSCHGILWWFMGISS